MDFSINFNVEIWSTISRWSASSHLESWNRRQDLVDHFSSIYSSLKIDLKSYWILSRNSNKSSSKSGWNMVKFRSIKRHKWSDSIYHFSVNSRLIIVELRSSLSMHLAALAADTICEWQCNITVKCVTYRPTFDTKSTSKFSGILIDSWSNLFAIKNPHWNQVEIWSIKTENHQMKFRPCLDVEIF